MRACTGGVCNPTCSFGWQSCDGSLDNGCESLRNTFSGALPNPTSILASVSGDEGQTPFVLQGYGETQVRIHVREGLFGFQRPPRPVPAAEPRRRRLPPLRLLDRRRLPHVELHATGRAATNVWASASRFASIPFLDCTDSFDVNVAITFDDANRKPCGLWTLTVYSNSDPADGSPNIDVD